MIQYKCDRCNKIVTNIKELKTIHFHEMNDRNNTCWDFQVSGKDICEQCARQLGDFLKPIPSVMPT